MSEATKPARHPTLARHDSSPWKDPAAWLLARGWEPVGDPYQPGCGWYDPTAPLEDKHEKVKVYAPGPDGKLTVPVMVKDANGKPIHAEQLKITPRRFPMSRAEAIDTQQRRERQGA